MKTSNLFVKYIVSYITLLLIPIIILGFLISNSFAGFLNDEINTSNMNLLEQAKKSIDSRFEEFNKLSIQIMNNPYLTSSYLSKDVENTITSIKLLNSFTTSNSFYSNFYIHYFDNNLMYSPTGTYTTNYFFNTIYKYNNWDLENIQKNISKSNKPFTMLLEGGSNQSRRYFAYIRPIPYTDDRAFGIIIYMIPYSSIQNILSNVLNSNNGSVLLVDNNSNIIASFGNNDLKLDKLSQIYMSKNLLAHKISLGDKKLFLSSIKSNYENWTYVALVPEQNVTSKLTSLRNMSILAFIFVFFIGFLLIYYLMNRNYKPLKELTKLTGKMLEPGQPASDGIESVHQAVNNMNLKIQTLEQRVETSIPALRNQLLQELLKGSFTDIEEFNLNGKNYELSLTGNYFAVAILLFNSLSADIKKQLSPIVKKLLISDFEGYTMDTTDDNRVVFIMSYKKSDIYAATNLNLKLQNQLKESSNIECTIGIGNWFSSPNEIANSYLQAYTALDYRLIKGMNTIIHYKDIEYNNKNVYFHPDELLKTLEKQILNRDINKVNETINKLILGIKENNVPLITARMLCYEIIQVILATIFRNGYIPNLDNSNYPDIISLAHFETVEELSNQIQEICLDIFSKVGEGKKTSNKQFDKILDYIHENYLDYNFSLQTVSDSMNMSMSYMSRYFKANANENISNYVNKLRMDKAKQLLIEDNLDLKDIAATVGYLNLSSFIRKFKLTMGVTPGVYREASHKESKINL